MPDRRPLSAFPPAGTTCEDCGQRPAAVYAGNAAICWQCDGQGSADSPSRRSNKEAAPEISAKPPAAKPARTKIARAAREFRDAAAKPKPAAAAIESRSTEEPLMLGKVAAENLSPAEVETIGSIITSYQDTCPPPAAIPSAANVRLSETCGVTAGSLSEAYGVTAGSLMRALEAVPTTFPIEIATSLTVTELDAFWAGLDPEQKAELIRHALLATLHRTFPTPTANPEESHA